ncbi:methionine ABC transporter ATP-binding protein [Acinetobacter sp. ANC 4633]|uniref:methionine ABC transporter ATP-binding protein n=1 Tax=Acinetobacter sp. ANC 4633 TaxID=2529845 RepID=UPI0010403C5E|nr:methionine ABC transporter ATP-binding protein [Acinetobacter sp. ANC 4633]TCB27963.1 methionine ABC transporter ATP-binding protein [Acinetobacter sp. ANC 4633]
MVSFGTSLEFSTPHIKIRNLNKYYAGQSQQVHALKDIQLDIPQGHIFGIIGKSGAGKSSLIRSLNGLEQPSSGQILIHQQDLTQLKHAELIQLRQKIGMIFQHFNLMSAKTVRENVALPLKIAGVAKAEISSRVNHVLELVGLSEKAEHYPAQLSGGQKQRVGIARALVHQPEILLCDEATSALDPESTTTILALLKKINQELGITIVLITHEMQVIRDICDEVVVIDHGEIVESGAVWSVFSNPQQQITQELLNLEQLDFGMALTADASPEHTQKILQIEYAHRADQAFDFNQLLQQFQSPVQILQSHIDQIQHYIVARLVIAVNSDHQTPDLQDWQHIQHLQFKELGYARSAI